MKRTLITVEGQWLYLPELPFGDEKVTDGNLHVTVTDAGVWTGGFLGSSKDVGPAVFFAAGSAKYKGSVSFEGKVLDDATGTLLGEGTLEMSVTGRKGAKAGDEWQGEWMILSGTGNLDTLHGHGSWWGPGWIPDKPTEHGVIDYDGTIYFVS